MRVSDEMKRLARCAYVQAKGNEWQAIDAALEAALADVPDPAYVAESWQREHDITKDQLQAAEAKLAEVRYWAERRLGGWERPFAEEVLRIVGKEAP